MNNKVWHSVGYPSEDSMVLWVYADGKAEVIRFGCRYLGNFEYFNLNGNDHYCMVDAVVRWAYLDDVLNIDQVNDQRIAELEKQVAELQAPRRSFNCIAGMPMDEMLKQIPGGARIDEAESFVESLCWKSCGESMHEHFGNGVTCAEAVLKLYERIRKARGEG